MISSVLRIPARQTTTAAFVSGFPRRWNSSSPADAVASARETIAAKAKAFEDKYAHKLKKKVEESGAESLEALKQQALAVKKEALEMKPPADFLGTGFSSTASPLPARPSQPASSLAAAAQKITSPSSNSPITPLASILNVPALLSSPHPFSVVSTLWQTLHTTKSITNPNRYISAAIPAETYRAMVKVARTNPQFVLPLPRPGGGTEFFIIQWNFYDNDESTLIFTSLEEYKQKGSWAKPFLILTHWTDLVEPSEAALMRGEISSSTPPKAGPGMELPESYLLSVADAQLLVLGMQRFYHLQSGDDADRAERQAVLEGFTKGTWQDNEWQRLRKLAVGTLAGIM